MIEQKYINGLKLCYVQFQKTLKNLQEFETKLNLKKESFDKFVEKTQEQLEEIKDVENKDVSHVGELENMLISYEKAIMDLLNDSKPIIEEHDKIKEEIKNIYESIMKQYSDKYTEEEIIDYIKTQL